MATSRERADKKCRNVKVVLLGDGGTGKTTFLKRYATGDFEAAYEPTIGVHVYPITFQTSVGQPLCFNCWDTSGQERLGTNRDAYYRGAECAILFFDVLSRITYKNCPLWYHDLKRVEPTVKMVLVANKVDVERRQVKPRQVTLHRKVDIPYVEMSGKTNFNVEIPFLHLAQALLKCVDRAEMTPPERVCRNASLELLEGPPLVAADFEIDLSRLADAEDSDSEKDDTSDASA